MRVSVASGFARHEPTAAAIGYAAVTTSGRQGARCGKPCHPRRAICLTDTAASRAQGGSGTDYSRPNANRGVCFAKPGACRQAKTVPASAACHDAGSLLHLVARLKPADVRRNGYARLCRKLGRPDSWARIGHYASRRCGAIRLRTARATPITAATIASSPARRRVPWRARRYGRAAPWLPEAPDVGGAVIWLEIGLGPGPGCWVRSQPAMASRHVIALSAKSADHAALRRAGKVTITGASCFWPRAAPGRPTRHVRVRHGCVNSL